MGEDWATLEGKWFHQIGEKGYANRQGYIHAEVAPGVYVVTYHEWISGGPSYGERLVSLNAMLAGGWRFYASNEDMRQAYVHGGLCPPSQREAQREALDMDIERNVLERA